ncbi:MAG: AsmA-like C-terminal domain-containing protein [Proteobacteria bacterium]|nr:AsmA-like C-terminal domain-containing protein [Pseudomonadota bacterium]
MFRRRLIILIQVLSGLLVGVGILFGVLAWRLSTSPVSLNFITPIIERNFSAKDKSYVVRVADTVLIWDGWRRPADVRARDIRVFNRDGKLLARLPQVSIGISMGALLRGRLAVSSLGIRRLRASVARYKDGEFTVGLMPADGAAQNIDGIIKSLARELSRSPSETDGAFGYLKRVAITESQLVFNDRRAGIVWRAPRADIIMVRGKSGLSTDAAIAFQVQDKWTRIFAKLDYRRAAGLFLAQTRFENLDPSLISRSVAGLGDFVNFNMPVTGEVGLSVTKAGVLKKLSGEIMTPVGGIAGDFEFAPDGDAVSGLVRIDRLDISEIAKRVPMFQRLVGLNVIFNGNIGGKGGRDGRITELEFNLVSGEGALEFPEIWNAPQKVKGIRLKGGVSGDFDRVDVAEAIIDFGGPKIEAEAHVQRVGDEARLQLDATLFELPFAGLDAYWPEALGKTARKWVTTNIREGKANETNMRLVGWMPTGDIDGLKVSSLNGTMRYEGLEVDYWSPLPKVKNAKGTATFSADRFDLVLSGGDLREIKIDQALINMFDLDTEKEQISIDILMQGPLKTALLVLDHKPLSYVKKLGVSADGFEGDAAIRLRMDFPLDSNVSRDALKVSSSATLKRVVLPMGPSGLKFTEGRLKFKLVDDDMKVAGPVKLNGVPVNLNWHEIFGKKGKIRSKYRLQAMLSDAQRSALALKWADFVSGPTGVDMTYIKLRSGNRHLKASIDLTEAEIARADLDFKKSAGEQASAYLVMEFGKDAQTKTADVKFSGAALGGEASLAFAPTESELWRLQLKQLSVKGKSIHGVVARRSDGVLEADVIADSFNIDELMAEQKAKKVGTEGETDKPAALKINAKIGVLKWGDKRQLKNADVSLRHDGSDVLALLLSGHVGEGKSFKIDYQPSPAGYSLDVETDDFGGSLQALDITKNVIGGNFKISGKRSSLSAAMEGKFSATQYRLMKVPAIARILQVASLTGIIDAFEQKGLEFDLLEGKFAYNGGLLRLGDTRTYGSSIGITTAGTVDLNNDKAELSGAVVPAYTINRIIGQIPLLGQILTGGDNEGMFAATYSLKGPLADPKVSVNPLTAFAPGILRKFFGVLGAKTGNPDAPKITDPDKSTNVPKR